MTHSPEAIVLVGHGAAARDTPRDLLRRLRALSAARHTEGGAPRPSEEEAALDREVRSWPRTAANDPYGAGVQALAEHLRRVVAPIRVVVAFNEMCAPTLGEALEALAAEGARRVAVVPTMVTPGGVHSEQEIPEELAVLRARFPAIDIAYPWPFDLDAFARFLAAHVLGQRL